MEKVIKIYEEVKRKAKIEKVRPDNISRFKEFLRIRWQRIEKSYPRKIATYRYLKRYLFDFFFEPIWQQKLLLHSLFKSKNPKSLTLLSKELNIGNQRFLSAKILQDMGLIELKRSVRNGTSIKKINHKLFKKYWPEIEGWNEIQKETKKGQQMERLFLILAERIKEKGFGSEVIEKVKEIRRADFKERNWEIKPRSLKNLKERVCKMPMEKFIEHLKVAERKLSFLFTKSYFLLK